MADSLSISVDASDVLRMLDRLDDRIGVALKVVARGTAERVRDEARARLARQTHGTGQTAEAITIEDVKGGFRVFVGPTQRPANLPLWLEQGTRRMPARPFLFASAELEQGPHLRRIAEAIQAVADEVNR